MKRKKIIALGISSALLTGAYYVSDFSVQIANASETTVAKQLDYKNLADGEYTLSFVVKNANESGARSMADNAIVKPAKLIVKNGEYKVQLTFQPLTIGNLSGYLGDISYYMNDTKTPAEILEWYPNVTEEDEIFKIYKKSYPNRTAYPKVFQFNLNKNEIWDSGSLVNKINVFVPVMASISPELGSQDALIEYDFNSIQVVSLDKKEEPKEDNTVENNKNIVANKTVKVDIKDEAVAKSQVRMAVDENARIEERDGKKYLILTYFSKQNWGADYKYDSGLMRVAYNYDGSDTVTDLTSKVIEKGEHYEISEVEIPVKNESEKIYVYGETQLNAITGTTRVTHGIITLGSETKIEKSDKVETPKLARVNQLGSYLKDSDSPKMPYDYEKNGQLYSPYTVENGTKFKLADGKYSVELQFDRPSFIASSLRYIKYTLDGSEPTFNSMSADFRSQTADSSLSTILYRIFVNPLEDIVNFSKAGGDVVVKVKGFNKEGTESSETSTYVLPFSSYNIDEVDKNVTINNEEYKAKLTSANNYALTEDADVKIEDVDSKVTTIAGEKAKQLGITDLEIKKISVVNKKGEAYTPSYVKGWNEDKNPLLKLELYNYGNSTDKQVYIYEGGELKLLPTAYSSYSKKYTININEQSAYYVFGSKNSKELLEEYKSILTKKVEEAKKVLESAATSEAKVKLANEIEAVEKAFSPKRIKHLRLDNAVKLSQNIDKYLSALEKANENVELVKNKAKTLVELVNNDIYKKILVEEQYNKIQTLKAEYENNKEDIAKLKEISSKLEQELNNLSYKYPTQDIEYAIEHYNRPGTPSMASGVFNPSGAKLIYAKDKTYMVLPLQTMTFAGIRAHLTDLDVFKSELDKEEFNVYSLAKYEDISNNGKLQLFDKYIVVELDKEVKKSYEVKLGNDGMGGAKPQARLVIKSEIQGNKKEEKLVEKLTNSKVSLETKGLKENYTLKVEKLTNIPEILKGKDVDLYDIEVLDKDKELELTGNIKITMEKTKDAKVENVYYVSEENKLEKLAFIEEGNKVSFEVSHLSKYAVEYSKPEETTKPNTEVEKPSIESSGKETTPKDDNKSKPSVELPNVNVERPTTPDNVRTTPKLNAKKEVNLKDFKNLPDGEYYINLAVHNSNNPGKLSMADGAVAKPAKLVVKNGKYRVELTFSPLSFMNQKGYLGNLAYYMDGSKNQATILEYYSSSEVDNFVNIYKKAFPSRTAYPKVLTFPINKEDIDSTGKLKTTVNVYVPVMASINPNLGNQDALAIFDFGNLKLIGVYEEGSSDEKEIIFDKNNVEQQDVVTDNTNNLSSMNPNTGGRLLALDGYKGGKLKSLSKTGETTSNNVYYYLALIMTLIAGIVYKKRN